MIDLNKYFLVYGYGVSGKSTVKFLKNNYCNYKIYDDKKNLSSVKKSITKKYLYKYINKFDFIVISPSIKIDKNHLLYKFKKKIIIDLDFLSISLKNQIVIGITGTEGKSTTCQYLHQTVSKKYKSIILGNFGNTILDKTNYKNIISSLDIIIIELSSYQLDKIKYLKLDYAIITNIYSDHISYHGNQKNYVKTKIKIQQFLKDDFYFFMNSKDFLKYSIHLKQKIKRKVIKVKSSYNKDKSKNLTYNINWQNYDMVKNIVNKIDPSISFTFSHLTDLPFRNEQIKFSSNFHNSKKISLIYNDSKCTNLQNAVMKNDLINSKNKILILGGKPKKIYENVVIKNTLVLIFGPHSDEIMTKISFNNSIYFKFVSLSSLVLFIKLIKESCKYNTILFSPGGESFDLYDNYIHRGKEFNSLIRKHKI